MSRRPLGSLDNNNVFRRVTENQDELIRREQSLIQKNNKQVRTRKVAPGSKTDVYPRLRRRYNKYGSKPPLTPAYLVENDGSVRPNPKLTMARGRYTTQRQCMYVPKKALMRMAKDMKISPFADATERDLMKGSDLWKKFTTEQICTSMREKYTSKSQRPIMGMTAIDDPRVRGVKRDLEFVAARLGVKLVDDDGKQKSMFTLSRDVSAKLG